MAGFIFQPQTLFSIGLARQFGGNTNPPDTSNPASGNGGQPIFKDYVTITESSVDALEITQQPVQQGAPISDHAFKKPTTLSIQILLSSSLTKSLASIYQDLLMLQAAFQPFNCTTPKRTYYNMLFASLSVTTEKGTENILSVNASFQQIITVPVGVTTLSKSQLRNPSSNSGVQAAGGKQLQSAAYTGWNALTGLAGGGR